MQRRGLVMQNRNTQPFWFKSLYGRISIEVAPEDTLATMKEKIANSSLYNAKGRADLYKNGFILICVNQQTNAERIKTFSDETFIHEMKDIFDIEKNNMGTLLPLNLMNFEKSKDSPFVYNIGIKKDLAAPNSKVHPHEQVKFIQSRYQQLPLEQKQYLSETTQSSRHCRDIGGGKHPSTENYFNGLSKEDQDKLLAGFRDQPVTANPAAPITMNNRKGGCTIQ